MLSHGVFIYMYIIVSFLSGLWLISRQAIVRVFNFLPWISEEQVDGSDDHIYRVLTMQFNESCQQLTLILINAKSVVPPLSLMASTCEERWELKFSVFNNQDFDLAIVDSVLF